MAETMSLEQIQAPVAGFLVDFNREFGEALESRSHWLSKAIDTLACSPGKQVRPLLVALIAQAATGKAPNADTGRAALLLELIHTASLIHDDVIDFSEKRRGQPTLNAIFDNRTAVLMGDYIFMVTLRKTLLLGNEQVLAIITELGCDLSEGEIRQFESLSEVNLDEANYMDVIGQKTASLFRASAEISAILSGLTEEEVADAAKIGESLGYAFQIRDDVFDYYNNDIGKPTGNDLREGKITLPLLHALTTTSGAERDACVELLEAKSFDETSLDRLTRYAISNGGIDYAYKRMEHFADEARRLIAAYPQSEARTALERLTYYIADRKY